MEELAVLAHQGGWDEALIVGVGIPGALFLVWKVLDRVRSGPAQAHQWDRAANHADESGTANIDDASSGPNDNGD